MAFYDTIKSAFDSVENLVKDMVTIDVVTLTGDINLTATDAGAAPAGGAAAAGGGAPAGGGEGGGEAEAKAKKPVSLSKLYQRLSGAALAGNINVVAFTHIEVDADSVNFVKSGLAPKDSALLDAHNQAVKAAQETREGLIATARSFLP